MGEVVLGTKGKKNSDMQNENRSFRQVNHTGIPTQLMERLEQSTGISLADVRVHYNSGLPAKLDALAYTKGNQVEIGPGQERHLPHELGHVVQQKLGAVRANAVHSSGVALNVDAELERQADEIGAGKRINGPCIEQGQVIQLYRRSVTADNVSYPDPLKTHVLHSSAKPTMVFESMGTAMRDCKEIFKQSEQYDGNTVCVFGLNECQDKKTLDTLKKEITNWGTSDGKNMGTGGKPGDLLHLLYVFPFHWSKMNDAENHGYEMPFVEARLEVMEKAETIVTNYIQPTDPDGPQNHFLYRWIDADARGDTSKNVEPEILNDIAKSSDNKILTGRYDWRHEGEEPLTDGASGVARPNGRAANASAQNTQRENTNKLYDSFIIRLNQAEKELRDYYHYLCTLRDANAGEPQIHPKDTLADDQVNGKAARHPFDNTSFLPGYYLPESALIMNQSAHDSIRRALRSMMENVGHNNILNKQDKESMRAVGMIVSGSDTDIIVYDSRLCVSKPLKNEYKLSDDFGAVDDGQNGGRNSRQNVGRNSGQSDGRNGGGNAAGKRKTSYWGSEMLKFLKGISGKGGRPSKSQNQRGKNLRVQGAGGVLISPEEKQFINGLNNLRQSAFSDWDFFIDSEWKQWEKWENIDSGPPSDPFDSIDKKLQRYLNVKKRFLEKRLWDYLDGELAGENGNKRLYFIRKTVSQNSSRRN